MHEKKYTLTEKLTQIAQTAFDKVVLQIKKNEKYETYTYRDLYDSAQKLAKKLLERDIRKGDRIAIVLENRPEWVIIYFGILFAGAIVTPFDPQSTIDEFKYFFENSKSKMVFTSELFQDKMHTVAKSIKTLKHIVLLNENKKKLSSDHFLPFADFLASSEASLDHIKLSPDDIASIIYTSGTTGKPKGVMLTHDNYYSNFHSIEKLGVFTKAHHMLSILPLHHVFPFMVTLLIPVFSESKSTYVTRLDSDTILTCMREVGVTILVGVPQLFYIFYQTIVEKIKHIPFYIRWPLLGIVNLFYHFRRLTNINLNKYILSKIHSAFGDRLVYFVSGGAKLDNDVEVFLNKVGFTVLQGYGLTETSPIVTLNPIKKQKIGSVGKVIPDVSIKITHRNKKNIGEVVIQGPNVMKGYYKRKKETEAVLKKGWFHSNDLGYLDKKGYLYLKGRENELIVLSNGKNISPEEVEGHYLKSHYIKEICVLSIDENESQKLVALIVPNFELFKKEGELAIYDILKKELSILSKNYPSYKCIMGFALSKKDLPRTRLGKLKRYEMKQRYLHALTKFQSQKQKIDVDDNQDLDIISSPLYNIIANIIKEEKPSIKTVNLNDHLGLDLNFDSLARIELISTLAKKLSITIPDTVVSEISTVKELIVKIDQLLPTKKDKIMVSAGRSTNKTSWKELLAIKPEKHITDKIDLSPNWISKGINLLFFGSLHFLFKIFFKIKIEGVKNLPHNKPFILCANHVSFLDAFFLSACLPRWLKWKIFFLGFRKYFEVPIIRHIIKIGHIIPVDAADNLKSAMQACSYILKNNKVVCIFPEGERSIDGSIQPFKKGVGILSEELNVSLVPIFIKGAFEVLPIGKFFPRFHQVSLLIGKACTANELKQKIKNLAIKDDYEAIAKGIQKEVEHLAKR